jgi:hypothetical protein
VAEAAAEKSDLGFVEAWVCDQPPRGVRYQVLRDEWVDDYRVRLIYEIKVKE